MLQQPCFSNGSHCYSLVTSLAQKTLPQPEATTHLMVLSF